MGFFNDFIGSFTGSNERNAAKKAAKGYTQSIGYTKDEIARARTITRENLAAAFGNIQSGVNSSVDATQQALAAQLQLLGAGTEELSPQGASNALTRGTQNASDILLGGDTLTRAPLPFTKIGTNPINTQAPQFKSPLLGNT